MYFISCYLRRRIVYVPTWGKIGKGYYSVIEPVSVLPVSDTDGLRRAFHEAFARGNPPVPRLPREQIPPPTILAKHAGVKDWHTFARGTLCWHIDERDGVTKITGQWKRPRGGWVDDPDQIVTFPPGSTIDDVFDRMIAILQEKARASSRGKAHT